MPSTEIAGWERRLGHSPVRGFFAEEEIDGLPEPVQRFGCHPFGGEITGYRTFGGLTVPSAGRPGWNFGTDRWRDGEFFRFEISHLRPGQVR